MVSQIAREKHTCLPLKFILSHCILTVFNVYLYVITMFSIILYYEKVNFKIGDTLPAA